MDMDIENKILKLEKQREKGVKVLNDLEVKELKKVRDDLLNRITEIKELRVGEKKITSKEQDELVKEWDKLGKKMGKYFSDGESFCNRKYKEERLTQYQLMVEALEQAMGQDMVRQWEKVDELVVDGIKHTQEAYNSIFSKGLEREAVNRFLEQIRDGGGSRFLNDIIWKNDIKAMEYIKNSIAEGLLKGDSLAKIGKDISNRLGVNGVGGVCYEIRTIARTETAYWQNRFCKEIYLENGVEKVRLLTAHEKNPCKFCIELEKKGAVDIEEIAKIPIHPNCRCVNIPIV